MRHTKRFLAGWVVGAVCAWPAYAQLGEAPMPRAAVPAPGGPTLEQTKQWIAGKLQEVGWLKVDKRSTYEGMRFDTYAIRYVVHFPAEDECRFTVAQIERVTITGSLSSSSGDRVLPESTTGMLGDLAQEALPGGDIGTVDGNKLLRRVNTMGYTRPEHPKAKVLLEGSHEEVIPLIAVSGTPDNRLTTDRLSFTALGDEVLAHRLASAFAHAGKLCRPIEAARRMAERAKSEKKPGELF